MLHYKLVRIFCTPLLHWNHTAPFSCRCWCIDTFSTGPLNKEDRPCLFKVPIFLFQIKSILIVLFYKRHSCDLTWGSTATTVQQTGEQPVALLLRLNERPGNKSLTVCDTSLTIVQFNNKRQTLWLILIITFKIFCYFYFKVWERLRKYPFPSRWHFPIITIIGVWTCMFFVRD